MDFGCIVSQEMFFVFLFFLVFPRKKLVFCPKPSFSYEKVGFPVQNHFFLGNSSFFGPKLSFS